jgi:hypothetical protein
MPKKKLTKEEFELMLLNDGRGIRLIGDFLDVDSRSEFQCKNNHRWHTRIGNVRGGGGCPYCSGHKISSDTINERLAAAGRGITLIGEYKSTSTKSLFRCDNGHEWYASSGSVLARNGCNRCSGGTLDLDTVNQRLLERGIQIIGEFTRTDKKSTFRCSEEHEWSARVNSVLNGHGCPRCTKSGFNPEKTGHVYLIRFGTFVKYGITNYPKQRLSQHRRTGEYEILLLKECSGDSARQWENTIKKQFGGKFVSKDDMPDGWTETLSLEHIQKILSLSIS